MLHILRLAKRQSIFPQFLTSHFLHLTSHFLHLTFHTKKRTCYTGKHKCNKQEWGLGNFLLPLQPQNRTSLRKRKRKTKNENEN